MLQFEVVKIEVLLPEEYIGSLRNELNKIGVLTIGDYDNVISYSIVKGNWRPLEGANPFYGIVGEISEGTECKLEFRCLYSKYEEAVNIIKRVHPYEEPVINVLPLLN